MENILLEASKKGMYVVDQENLKGLFAEHDQALEKVNGLSEVIDEEATPFKSKYEARSLLDTICNKLEATRTVSSLEGKKEDVKMLNKRIANTRLRIGTLSWECEEPHTTQTELGGAADYYFPDLGSKINKLSEFTEQDEKKNDELDFDTASISESLQPISVLSSDLCVDAMKCLNMLGILWAGRQNHKRALCYLLYCKEFYESAAASQSVVSAMTPADKDAMELELTHNLFYLAQAYGHMGDAKRSAHYCHQTLQRQLSKGVEGASALEWAKNCMGLADFYLAMNVSSDKTQNSTKFRLCAQALCATQSILNSKLRHTVATLSPDNKQMLKEIEADLNRRMARMLIAILRSAHDRIRSGGQLTASDADMDSEGAPPMSVFSFVPRELSTEQRGTGDLQDSHTIKLFGGLSADSDNVSDGSNDFDSSFEFYDPLRINNFEDSRVVFLRAAARLETAKKDFPMDGCVTDHVKLLQEYSQAYHLLAGLETDSKRRLAMENRRIDMLLPVIKNISKSAYDVLHKQVSYELGEAYMGMMDIKMEKLKQKGRNGAIDLGKLKNADVEKCNGYCHGALATLGHFTNTYAKEPTVDGRRVNFEGEVSVKPWLLSLDELIAGKGSCTNPDEGLITAEEVRPFLNAHFLCCRVMSKVLPLSSTPSEKRAVGLVASLARYQWLVKYAPGLCEKKGVSLGDTFEEEFHICKEMVELLPAKIDKVHFHGELSLLG
eukprot:gene4246-8442_t